MLAILDDFLWALRREGFGISTPQAIDAARAAREVGFADKELLREAIACVVVDVAARRKRYDVVFDDYFSTRAVPRGELVQRLLARGFSRTELGALRELLREFLVPDG